MGKSTRVYELAETLNLQAQELLSKINTLQLGFTVKNVMSTLTESQVKLLKNSLDKLAQDAQNTAIDEKSQSTAQNTPKGTRIRRRKAQEEDNIEPEAEVKIPSPTVRTRAQSKPSVVPEGKPKQVSTKAEPVHKVSEAVKVEADKREEHNKVEKVVKVQEPVVVEEAVAEKKESKPEELEQLQQVVVEEAREEGPKEVVVESLAEVSTEAEPLESVVKSVEKSEPETEKKVVDSVSEVKAVSSSSESKKSQKQKSEILLEIQPKFESESALEFSHHFEDEEEDLSVKYQDSEVVEEEDEDEEEELRLLKKSKRKTKTKKSLEDVESQADIERISEQKKKSSKPSSQVSNISGYIDPELILNRLNRDNKIFSAGSVEKKSQEKNLEVVHKKGVYVPTPVESVSSNVSLRKHTPNKKQAVQKKPEKVDHTIAAEHKRVVKINDTITINDLARDLGVKANEIIKMLFGMGTQVTINQSIDIDTAEIIAQEYGHTVQNIAFKEENFIESEVDKPEDLVLRPPVITVMGHVDHGKTSLLDAFRNSKVTETEAGGITQHIGASSITTDTGKIVLLDTPGHEAFTTLRARGAKVTDLVVLVVAADDGVMPQTVEAINHAKAANVPIIVAINKIDKNGANPERVKQALTEFELIPEEWGGTTIFKEVSAVTGQNIPELLELIQLQAEILELKANPDKDARGIVLEAYKDPRKGIVANVLVQEGTLKTGQIIVSGAAFGKIKSMKNDKSKQVKSASPSTPLTISGLNDIPEAGEIFFVAKDEKTAKEFTEEIKNRKRNAELSSKKFDPWAAFKENKVLNVIIKADVQGSLEALEQSLLGLSTNDVELVVVHSAVGGTTESDVQLAVASNALIIGFNTRPEARAIEVAKREGIEVETFSIIYDVIDYIKDAMSGLLDPILKESIIGHAEVRNTFNVPKVGTIAGCYVTDGKIVRNAKVRLLRDGKIIYESKISSLKRFKDDAKEVRSGFECGLGVENYNDLKIKDVIEVFEIQQVKQSI